jgi:hypothetical protein
MAGLTRPCACRVYMEQAIADAACMAYNTTTSTGISRCLNDVKNRCFGAVSNDDD